MRAVVFSVFLYAIAVSGQTVQAESSPYSELGLPYMQNFEPSDYGARPDNQALVQADNGLMYIGNSYGILEYDGVNWRMIELPNNGIIKTLHKDKNGKIFVGGFNEIGYLTTDSLGFTAYQSFLPNLNPEYHNMGYLRYSFSVNDTVYFQASNHLFSYVNNQVKTWIPAGGLQFSAAVNGVVYVQETDRGLSVLKQDKLELLTPFTIRITSMAPIDQNTILIGTYDQGLFLMKDNRISPFPTSVDNFLKEKLIGTILRMPNGWLTVGTRYGGLVVLDKQGQLVRIFDKASGLINAEILAQELDNQGGLWLGLNRGVCRLELLSPYTIFDQRLGVSSFVNAITRHDGKLIAAASQGALQLHNAEGGAHCRFEKIADFDRSYDVAKLGKALLIASDKGLFAYENAMVERISPKESMSVYSSRKDSTLVFVGHLVGLSVLRKNNNGWQDLGRIKGIDDDIREFVELKDGKLWLESQIDGVWLIDFYPADTLDVVNPTIKRFLANKQLSPGVLFLHSIKGEAFFEISGRIYKYHPEIDSIMAENSFGDQFGFNGDIVPKLEDPWGNLWISGQLAGSDDREKQRTMAIPQEDGSYKVVHIRDNRITHAAKKALFPEESGILWYGGVDGIIRQNLNMDKLPIENFKAHIRKISMDGDSLLFGGTMAANTQHRNWNFANNTVRFEFAAPSYDETSLNRYQYILEGYDKGWSKWSAETVKDYTKIPEGNYVFRVRSRNVYKQISEEEFYSFTVLPPMHRTWWAYTFYFLLLVGLFFGALRWRSHQLKARNVALEKLIDLRTFEVQHQANQLKIQAEKLQDLDKAKSRFFANISHEFRTPLTLIKGPIEHLEEHTDERLSRDTVKMIRRNANRLLQMVNQLLDLSKIDEGSLKLTPTEGDVFKCLRAASSSFNSHAAQRNVDYKVQIPQTVLWASFDRDKLENIVYNLLGNAFKFSQDSATVSFLASYGDTSLQIVVSDTGKGIPGEKLPFIFDRFYQADSSTTRDKEGSGIGLSLSRDLAVLMGGGISVSSQPGKGTIFTLQLPLEEIQTGNGRYSEGPIPPKPQSIKKTFALARADNRELPHILLVEDNSDMRHFIREQLKHYYRVSEAVNGEAGLNMALSHPTDLIITDLMMPRMDGMQLCRKLKANLHTSHIPVIMLTAKAGLDNKIEGLETGADDYLTKPFEGRELLVRIKNLLEQRQRLRELYSNREQGIDPKQITVTSLDQRFLENLLELLETEHPNAEFGVPQMQRSMAMSKTQLHCKLKALTNEAPGELLRNFRLKRAAQLLRQQEDNVTQIAYKVGFNNLSYFAKCFKELYGVPPSSY